MQRLLRKNFPLLASRLRLGAMAAIGAVLAAGTLLAPTSASALSVSSA